MTVSHEYDEGWLDGLQAGFKPQNTEKGKMSHFLKRVASSEKWGCRFPAFFNGSDASDVNKSKFTVIYNHDSMTLKIFTITAVCHLLYTIYEIYGRHR